MNVLVTGAAGFIGSHIWTELLRRGHDVCGIDDLSGGFLENLVIPPGANVPNYTCVYDDCCDLLRRNGSLSTCGSLIFEGTAFKNGKGVDTVVHCAANAREGASQFQPNIVTRRNYMASVAVLTAAIRAGVKRFVMFSSMAVYGEGGSLGPPFDEDRDLEPEDVYAVNKVAMEQTTRILSGVHDCRYVILRPHNVFGERQSLCDRFRNVVGIFMNLLMRGEPLTIYGDGDQTRAFSYIEDSLPAFIYAIENVDALHGSAINVGGMESVSVNELAEAVQYAMNTRAQIRHLPDRPCEVKHAFTTYAKSVDLLGYSEKIGWGKGVIEMAKWAQEQGPKEWVNNDPLELEADSIPTVWRPRESP